MRSLSYKKYKSSDIEWIARIPTHWDTIPLKRLHHVVNGGTPSSSNDSYWNGEITWITPEDLGINKAKTISVSRRTISTNGLLNSSASLVPPRSIFISTRAPIGHIAISEKMSSTNQGCRTLVSKGNGMYCDYVYYSLLASRHLLQANGTGTTFLELSTESLGLYKIPLPPITEQICISNFLDLQLYRIDLTIENSRKLIERIKEKRVALISRSLTQGLPVNMALNSDLYSSTKLKPSGVLWLGDLPERWAVQRLKYVASINDETLSETTDPKFAMSYVDIGSVDPIRGIVSSEEMIFEDAPSRARRIVRDGDTIVSTVRTYLRAIAFVRNPEKNNMIVSTGFAVVRPQKISSHFLAYILSDPRFVNEIMARSLGVSYPAVNAAEIGNIWIPLPEKSEQKFIAEYLDRETARLDTVISEIEMAIKRLGEYRNTLVTAAVTGKIDVRKVEHLSGDSGNDGRQRNDRSAPDITSSMVDSKQFKKP